MTKLPKRLWIQLGLGASCAALLALTLAIPDWLEVFFGLVPDGGDGTIEGWLAITLAAVTLVLVACAGRTWRRHLQVEPAGGAPGVAGG